MAEDSSEGHPVRVLLAHPGTQHSHHLARQLERHQMLECFWTGLGFAENSTGAVIARLMRSLPGMRGLGSRVVHGVPRARIRTTPFIEFRALRQLRGGGDPVGVLHERNATFQAAIPDLAIRNGDAVIGFDTSSWSLAGRCAKQGKPFYLDRTIAHPAVLERLMTELALKYPEWTGPIVPRLAEVVEAETIEHSLARQIVVGGSFARETLVAQGIAPERITVNPYGVDWSRFSAIEASQEVRPFRFLYVGSVIARKGIPVLLDAWRALAPRDAELWIAGSIGARERGLIPELPGLRLLGQIAHSEMASVYANCDVFVLPSLFEGFGLVILEALASGLPVVSTPHTGAVEAVTEDILGRLVPVASVDALIEAMRHYLSSPPNRPVVADAASGLRERFSWRAYGDRWKELLTRR